MRAHLYENLVTSTTALHSLSLLVESLTTMKVLEHIQVLLEVSVRVAVVISHMTSAVCLPAALAGGAGAQLRDVGARRHRRGV